MNLRTIVPESIKGRIRRFVRGADRPSGIAIGQFGGRDIAYRRGTTDVDVLLHSFDRDVYLAQVSPEYEPKSTDVVLDVGAHIGTFALHIAPQVKTVHAIEASEDACNLVRINAALNHHPSIRPHHLAIAAKDSTVTLYHAPGNWGHSTVAQLSKRTESVPALSLASFLSKNRIESVDLAKFNVEGAEFPILLSSNPETLRKIRIMLVLYHCDLWAMNTPKDIIEHLGEAGFDCSKRFVDAYDRRGSIVAVRKD